MLGSGGMNSEWIEYFWVEFQGHEDRQEVKFWKYQHIFWGNPWAPYLSLGFILFETESQTEDNYLKYFAGSHRVRMRSHIENSERRPRIRELDASQRDSREADVFELLFWFIWALHPNPWSENRAVNLFLQGWVSRHLLSSVLSSLHCLLSCSFWSCFTFQLSVTFLSFRGLTVSSCRLISRHNEFTGLMTERKQKLWKFNSEASGVSVTTYQGKVVKIIEILRTQWIPNVKKI
jgi:hypothetical protein